jgi:hypothetical protein
VYCKNHLSEFFFLKKTSVSISYDYDHPAVFYTKLYLAISHQAAWTGYKPHMDLQSDKTSDGFFFFSQYTTQEDIN